MAIKSNETDEESPINFGEYNYATLVRHNKCDNVLELEEVLQSYEKAKIELYRKKFELELIETFALYSNEPSIAAIRKQLYTMIKLTYGQQISTILNEHGAGVESDYIKGYAGTSCDSDGTPLSIYEKIRLKFWNRMEKLSTNVSNWHNFFHGRQNTRDQHKKYINRLGM